MAVGFVVAVVSGGYLLLTWGHGRGLSRMRGRVTIKDDSASVLWRWRAENDPGYNRLLRRFYLESKEEAGRPLSDDETNQLAKLDEQPLVHPATRIAGIAAAIACLLAYVRLTFLRFPLHPLGYALATTQLMHYFWFSIFLAWMVRLVGLRLGGVRAIKNHLRPYMIGLILGSVAAVLLGRRRDLQSRPRAHRAGLRDLVGGGRTARAPTANQSDTCRVPWLAERSEATTFQPRTTTP